MIDITYIPDNCYFSVMTPEEAEKFTELVSRDFWHIPAMYNTLPLVLSRQLKIDEILHMIGLHGSWDYALPQDVWDQLMDKHRRDNENCQHPSEFVWWYPDRTIKPDASLFGELYNLYIAKRKLARLITEWAIGTPPETILVERREITKADYSSVLKKEGD